jgi:AraC family transcriptional regulator
MPPGSLLLGNVDHCFECGHEHGTGDPSLSFGYAPDYFERLAVDAGIRGGKLDFLVVRIPPLRELSTLIARACAGLIGSTDAPWEELSVKLAIQAVRLAGGLVPGPGTVPQNATARVSRPVRAIESNPDNGLALATLAQEAGLSPYHFLRIFERLTGVTPHQYILRIRLRKTALRLAAEPANVLDIALDSGFGDVSNFNRTFRAEFGVSPTVYRRAAHGTAP